VGKIQINHQKMSQAALKTAFYESKRWGRGLGGLLTQTTDWSCPRTDEWLLDPHDSAELFAAPYCVRCGRTTGAHEATERGCSACLHQRFAWRRLTRLCAYQDPVPQWFKAMKYQGQWPIAQALGAELAEQISGRSDQVFPDWLVTHVPMHPLRRWARGYDQAQLIAQAIAAGLAGLAKDQQRVHVPLLRRVQRTPKQSRVEADQRTANVKNAFAVAPVDLTGRRVLLVDDVKTSGATLKACSRALRKAGAAQVDVAVIAVA